MLLGGGFTESGPVTENTQCWELRAGKWQTIPDLCVPPGASVGAIPGGFITAGPFREVIETNTLFAIMITK